MPRDIGLADRALEEVPPLLLGNLVRGDRAAGAEGEGDAAAGQGGGGEECQGQDQAHVVAPVRVPGSLS